MNLYFADSGTHVNNYLQEINMNTSINQPKSELEQLREDVAKLRERIAVLEARPFHAVYPMWTPIPNQLFPPWIVTSGVAADHSGRFAA